MLSLSYIAETAIIALGMLWSRGVVLTLPLAPALCVNGQALDMHPSYMPLFFEFS